MLEHGHFKNLSYTEFRRKGGAVEAVTFYKLDLTLSAFLTKSAHS